MKQATWNKPGTSLARSKIFSTTGSNYTDARAPLQFEAIDPRNLNAFPVFGDQALTDFGGAVAIDGDVLVVGDSRYKGEATVEGAAFVYRFVEKRWVEEIVLQVPDSEQVNLELFGLDVDVSGDWIAVAASAGNDAGTGEGATFLWHFNDFRWVFDQAVEGSDLFNHAAIALDGDRLAVGRPKQEGGLLENGRRGSTGGVSLFEYDGTDWQRSATLFPEQPQADCVGDTLGYFGWALDMANGVLIVGSPRHAKRVYSLREMRGEWGCAATRISPQLGNPGWSVAFDGRRAVFGSPLVPRGRRRPWHRSRIRLPRHRSVGTGPGSGKR